MTKRYITYFSLLGMLLLTACSGGGDEALVVIPEAPQQVIVPEDEPWEDTELDGASATITPFLPGNDLTRSTYVFSNQQLVFGWESRDHVGLYPTAKVVESTDSKDGLLDPATEANRHPEYVNGNTNIWRTDPRTNQYIFSCPNNVGSQSATLYHGGSDFEWDETTRWTSYLPYTNNNGEDYTNKTFSFENQVQRGLPDMIACAKYNYGVDAVTNNATYKASETKACIHLGEKDALISPEMAWNGTKINFQLRHIGAVARFYLLAPEDNLVITKLRLICDKKIFHKKGTFDLTSHPYKGGEFDFGVDFNTQISPAGEATQELELDFAEGQCLTSYNADPTYGRYGRYLIAYLMMYPVDYQASRDGNLYVYVTGYQQGDATKQERRFVSQPLADMNMKSGYYYQWVSTTTGLEIELTATLLPWQTIVGGNINADLTK